MMGWASVIALCQQFFPEFAEMAAQYGLLPHSHGHHHGAGDLGPNINAAWLAGGSILVKEWLYRASRLPRSHILASANVESQPSRSPRNGNPPSSPRTPTTTVSTLLPLSSPSS